MSNIITQLHSLKPDDLLKPLELLKREIEELKQSLNQTKPTEYLSRKEVALLLKTNPQTVSNWTKEGKLKIYGLGGRRYYIRREVEQALIELNQ
ncbi:helix-turn-helix domain-containing protein [Winogradskyella poriferorum]|uniref:helix-turn-helix domain-containing protein n=1 Tax=Winogradskyella poriferorum TaxID=307627 RepID=UPI003D65BFDB